MRHQLIRNFSFCAQFANCRLKSKVYFINASSRYRINTQRAIHSTRIVRINPLLPFDPLESIEDDPNNNDEDEGSKKLQRKKQNKKIAEQIEKKLDEKIKERLDNQLKERSINSLDKNKENSIPDQKYAKVYATLLPHDVDRQNQIENENKKAIEAKRKRDEKEREEKEEQEQEKKKWRLKFLNFFIKILETGSITFVSIAILGFAGLIYHRLYEFRVLDKMNKAFDKGDTSFDIEIHENASNEGRNWMFRPQQELIDDIVSGKIVGRYFLIIGEKGTGKSSMVLESFRKVEGLNCVSLDAHADPEIFRIRLGKALNFHFYEDYIGSLFNIRGPRDTTALLDIERAFGKLEEVSILRKRKQHNNKPLIIFINNAHLIKEDEPGIQLVELLQQKAEELCGAGLATILVNSDDYWLYERMKKLSTKLEIIQVGDFTRQQTIQTLKYSRMKHFPNEQILDDKLANRVYDLIGGRPQHISQVAQRKNIIRECHAIIDNEKTWFLNQCGLLGDAMDDDVNEYGKFSTLAMVLAKEFVKLYSDMQFDKDSADEHKLPKLPLWKARQIMTRPDYIRRYDDLNIYTIDSESFVKPDSVPMMRAFCEIVEEPGFEELLSRSEDRVAEIESLGRTREIMLKDLNLGGKYIWKKRSFVLHKKDEDSDDNYDDNDDDMIPMQRADRNLYWAKRMESNYATAENQIDLKEQSSGNLVNKDSSSQQSRSKD